MPPRTAIFSRGEDWVDEVARFDDLLLIAEHHVHPALEHEHELLLVRVKMRGGALALLVGDDAGLHELARDTLGHRGTAAGARRLHLGYFVERHGGSPYFSKRRTLGSTLAHRKPFTSFDQVVW